MKRLKLRRSTKFSLFFSMVLFFIIQMLLIWGIGFSWVTNQIRLQYQERYENLGSRIIKNVNQITSGIENYSIAISNTASVLKISSKYFENNYFEMIKLREQLDTYKILSNYIDEIFIYYVDKDIVISTITNSLQSKYFFKYFFSIENLSSLNTDSFLKKHHINRVIFKKVRIHEASSNGLLFLNTIPFPANIEPRATIGFFLSRDKIEKLITNAVQGEKISIIIIDSDNNFIVGYENGVSDIKLLKDYISHNIPAYNRLTKLEINKVNYYAMKTLSDKYGLTYLITIPEEYLVKSINRIRLIISILFLLFTVLGIVFIYYYSVWNAKPIENIMSILSGFFNDEYTYNGNEMEWMENGIKKLIQQEKKLMQTVNESMPHLKAHYFERLLTNDFENEFEILRRLKLAGVDFRFKLFACTIIYFCEPTDDIINYFEDQNGSGIDQYLVLKDKKCIALLYNTNSETSLFDYINTISDHLCSITQRYTIAVGGIKNSIGSIRNSYDEARISLDYKAVDNKNNIIYYDNIINEMSLNSYYYPINEENHIINYLRAGDFTNAISILKKLAHENLRREGQSIGLMRNFFIHAFMTAYRALEHSDKRLNKKYEIKNILGFHNYFEVENYVMELFRDVADLFKAEKSNTASDLKQRIIEYIDAHYREGSLSLTTVADALKVHKVYLSSYFNEHMGCNFVDYVNRKRIKYAVECIHDPSLTIKEVAQLSGFNSEATFRRVFKKYHGMSPGEYRNNISNS